MSHPATTLCYAIAAIFFLVESAVAVDSDSDGVDDPLDNCTLALNASQTDTNGDGFGNACDADYDNNGVVGLSDLAAVNAAFSLEPGDPGYDPDLNCDEFPVIGLPDLACMNTTFAQPPGPSGLGGDHDVDGWIDPLDNCPAIYNPDQADEDDDGEGDACEIDADDDGEPDVTDNCLLVPNASQTDTNGDGFGNACDADYDNNGVVGLSDFAAVNAAFSLEPGDPGYDPDLNCDEFLVIGLPDLACMNTTFAQPPGPSGLGGDQDVDGWIDPVDNCPETHNSDQADTDGDGLGDGCEIAPGPPPGFDPDAFTVVFLPDTQNYIGALSGIPAAHSQWICENRWDLNIVLATHLGDVANSPSQIDQYERVSDALMTLGQCDVAWSVVPGNHDQELGLPQNHIDYTTYRSFFPALDSQVFPWFGGASPVIPSCLPPNFCEEVNTFQIVDTRLGFSVLHIGIEHAKLQIGLPNWVSDSIEAHPDHPTLLTTHAHVQPQAGGQCSATSPDFYDTVIDHNPEVFFVSNGHFINNTGECEGATSNGADLGVIELYANYQQSPLKQAGWLRYCTFHPASDTAVCETYSPLLDEFRAGSTSVHEVLGILERTGGS